MKDSNSKWHLIACILITERVTNDMYTIMNYGVFITIAAALVCCIVAASFNEAWDCFLNPYYSKRPQSWVCKLFGYTQHYPKKWDWNDWILTVFPSPPVSVVLIILISIFK